MPFQTHHAAAPARLGAGSACGFDFVGLGAPKCGTTWVSRMLATHPQAMVSGERDYFTFDSQLNHKWDQVLAQYRRAQKEKGSDFPLLGTHYNDYLYSAFTAGFLASLERRPRLYVVLRDPVARAVSAYLHLVAWTGAISPSTTLRQAMEDYPKQHLILEHGFYDRYLAMWLDLFPREDVLIIIHEDIAAAPDRVLGQLQSFLGLGEGCAPQEATQKINSNLLKTMQMEPDLLAMLESAYQRTRENVGRLIGRDLGDVWGGDHQRLLCPTQEISPQEVLLARARMHLDNGPQNYGECARIILELNAQGFHHPAMDSLVEDLGRRGLVLHLLGH